MKKTKIIVPALAMIALSTAASIAGSVAWFTASRSATVTASSFSVVKTSANLDCTVGAGIGTILDTAHENAVLVEDGATPTSHENYLSDASFDHINGLVFEPNGDGSALKDNSGVSIVGASASTFERGDLNDGKIYSVVTFELEFKVTFGSLAGDYGLYLDNTQTDEDDADTAASKFSCTDADLYTAKGFRMAFYGATPDSTDYPGSSVHTTVFADYRTSSEATYCNGASTFENGQAYNQSGAQDLIDSTYKAALPTSSTARATAMARPDFLGLFKYKEGSEVTLSYTVVCWFEGTDEEIVNRDLLAEYQTVTSTLRFEAVQLADA